MFRNRWWFELYVRQTMARDGAAVAMTAALALGGILGLSSRDAARSDGALPTGNLVEAAPADDPLTPSHQHPSAPELPPPDEPAATAATPAAAERSSTEPERTSAAISQTNSSEPTAKPDSPMPATDSPRDDSPPPSETASQPTADSTPVATTPGDTSTPSAQHDAASNKPSSGPGPHIPEKAPPGQPPQAARNEIVEVFVPGRPKSPDEKRSEERDIAAFEQRRHEGKYRLIVDLSPLSRDELARVCAAFCFKTRNRTVYLSPAGSPVNPADFIRNRLVGDRPDLQRVPRAAADQAAETLGEFHNADITCLFTDECALTLYRALDRAIHDEALAPGDTFELQLRPAPDGRIEGVAVTPSRRSPPAPAR